VNTVEKKLRRWSDAMGDTANGSWGSRELGAHIRQTEREKRREEDWQLACVAAEFAFKSAEKGNNLEMTLSNLVKVFNGEV
jgi:hypothetical protein